MLLKRFQIAPAGKFIDCCVMVKLFALCISNDADFWHELYVNLHSLARKMHLFVRFWNVFRIWQLFGHLALTTQDTV